MQVQERLIIGVIQAVKGTDTQAAQVVGIPYKAFHAYKHGRNVASDEAILKMADFLGENALEALAQHHIEHAENERVKTFWQSLARVACTVLLLAPVAHHAIAAQVPFFVRVTGGLHIMFGFMLHCGMMFARVSLLQQYRVRHVSNPTPRLLA